MGVGNCRYVSVRVERISRFLINKQKMDWDLIKQENKMNNWVPHIAHKEISFDSSSGE